MAINTIMQERAVFYLDRRISALETNQVDHDTAASAVSYAERRRLEASLKDKNEKQQHELAAMQWCRARMLEVR